MAALVEGIIKATEQGMQYGGAVAQRLLQVNGDVEVLRTNATLQHEEWIAFDTEMIRSYRDELIGIADLKRRNLVFDMKGKGLNFTVLKQQTMTNAGNAYVSMTGLGRGESDLPEFDLRMFPLPIIASDWFLDFRHLMESRNMGTNLDTTMAANAGAEIADLQETILFNGYNAYSFGGGNIYGYTDFPHRHTGNLTANWSLAGTTGAQIVRDVQNMIEDLILDKQYGPYVMYIPPTYQMKLSEDYSANYPNKTIRQRMMEVTPLLEDIKISHKLNNTVLLIQMKTKTIRMVTGLPLKNLEWQEQGGLVFKYKGMTIDIPQIRTDTDNRCGIAHYSVAG